MGQTCCGVDRHGDDVVEGGEEKNDVGSETTRSRNRLDRSKAAAIDEGETNEKTTEETKAQECMTMEGDKDLLQSISMRSMYNDGVTPKKKEDDDEEDAQVVDLTQTSVPSSDRHLFEAPPGLSVANRRSSVEELNEFPHPPGMERCETGKHLRGKAPGKVLNSHEDVWSHDGDKPPTSVPRGLSSMRRMK